MNKDRQLSPTSIVIFGGSGDLNKRKLIPALYNLFVDRFMPEKFYIMGLGRTEYSDQEFREYLKESLDEFSRRPVDEETWSTFSDHIVYKVSNVKEEASYRDILEDIKAKESEWNEESNRVFYLSVSPSFFETIAVNLGRVQACDNTRRSRIVIEKPFGHDLTTARGLNRLLSKIFTEDQIYRIDHYLGKEAVQNILTARFANVLFEPLWNRNYIDHVQITVSETVGVEGRGGYYEGSGALRDMVQNHVLQLLSMVAMEPPISLEATEIRNKKVDVLKAMRRYSPSEVKHHAVRGQYGPGWVKGKEVKGYRDEEGVAPDSNTETYAAVKFFVDNWRWQDVPFYIRTGKSMADKTSVITIQLKSVPHRAFAIDGRKKQEPNRIIMNIQPDSGISIRFQAKRPGVSQIINPVDMIFDYEQAYDVQSPEAYETLLLDVIEGDASLFMRGDQVEAAWEVIMPILNEWEKNPIDDYPSYEAGSWGPKTADRLLAQQDHRWINPPARNAQTTVIKATDEESRRKGGVVNLHVFQSTDDLSYSAAELFAKRCRETVNARGRFVVALSGGSSSKKLYKLLTQDPFRDSLPWDKVHVFWGDERPVGIDHEDSNAGMAFEAMLNELPIPKEQIHPIQGQFRPDVAAQQYEETLQNFFHQQSPRFDLILLGMGDDGHTASLFPHTLVSTKKMSWVQEVFVDKMNTHRITLTPQLINQAGCVAFVAYGSKKADALKHVLKGEYQPQEYPAQLIHPEDGEVHWFVDKDAASELNGTKETEAKEEIAG